MYLRYKFCIIEYLFTYIFILFLRCICLFVSIILVEKVQQCFPNSSDIHDLVPIHWILCAPFLFLNPKGAVCADNPILDV